MCGMCGERRSIVSELSGGRRGRRNSSRKTWPKGKPENAVFFVFGFKYSFNTYVHNVRENVIAKHVRVLFWLAVVRRRSAIGSTLLLWWRLVYFQLLYSTAGTCGRPEISDFRIFVVYHSTIYSHGNSSLKTFQLNRFYVYICKRKLGNQ
jgi:hypothetical protein